MIPGRSHDILGLLGGSSRPSRSGGSCGSSELGGSVGPGGLMGQWLIAQLCFIHIHSLDLL